MVRDGIRSPSQAGYSSHNALWQPREGIRSRGLAAAEGKKQTNRGVNLNKFILI